MTTTTDTATVLKEGDQVPNFSVAATDDQTISLQDFRGKKLVIYFYPKDSTPGCTIESCGFRDQHDAFEANNTVVLGVSRDSLKSHEKFKARHEFPFDLLSDGDEALCQIFGVLKEKSLFGKKFMGIERSTFLIDEQGVLQKAWRKVKVKGHVQAVLDAVKSQPIDP
jgi:thioredoxin-dependent peroxiredoxin